MKWFKAGTPKTRSGTFGAGAAAARSMRANQRFGVGLTTRRMPRSVWLFLFCVIPALLAVALFVPLHEVPDEAAHAVRAGGLARGQLLGHHKVVELPDGSPFNDSGSDADPGLMQVAIEFRHAASLADKHVTWPMLRAELAEPWADRETFVPTNNTASNPPWFYVPAAIGIRLGRIAGAGPFASLILGRLCNAVVYMGLGALALVLARGVRPVLLAVLLLPMSIWLGGSLNQDGPMLVTTALAVALLSRTAGPDDRFYWIGGLLLSSVIVARPFNLPFAVVMLIAGGGVKRLWLRRLAGVALAVVPAILWFVLVRPWAASPMVLGAPYVAGPLWPGPAGAIFASNDTASQMRVLLADPWRILSLPWAALRDFGLFRLREMLGVLGQLDVVLPAAAYVLLAAGLIAALLSAMAQTRRDPARGPWSGPLSLAAALSTLWLIYIGLYLAWTPVGAVAVEGVQGRYFLPTLLIASLGLPALQMPDGLRRSAEPLVALSALMVAGLLPAVIALTYYVR